LYIGDDTVAHRDASGRTLAHNVSHPPVTLSISKRPHVEHESASEADGASEQDYESYVISACISVYQRKVSVFSAA